MGGKFDVVVANILRKPLLELAPVLAAAAAPGARLGWKVGKQKIRHCKYKEKGKDLHTICHTIIARTFLLV